MRELLRERKLEKIDGIQDIHKLPFTSKKDISNCFPFGALAVPLDEVVRVHTSSGSTSKPITTFYTQGDLERWSDQMARGLACVGARRGDIFQNTTSQGFFTGGLGLIQGAERLGLTVVPFGSGNPDKQLEVMRDFSVTVFHCIPSFAIRMMEALEAQPSMRGSLKIRIGVMGAEPWTREMRNKIEDSMNICAFNNYGLAEMGGPGVAIECPAREGLHVWEDHFVMEVVDPKTGEPLGVEEQGELVLTPLNREAMPLLRYRTGDLTRILDGPCECGRAHRRIDWFTGRIDDMIKVRGIGLYPSNIERIVASHREANGNFQILLTGIDDITIRLEVTNGISRDQAAMNALRAKVFEEIKDLTLLRTNVEALPQGTLPRSEGKAKRVLDQRRLL